MLVYDQIRRLIKDDQAPIFLVDQMLEDFTLATVYRVENIAKLYFGSRNDEEWDILRDFPDIRPFDTDRAYGNYFIEYETPRESLGSADVMTDTSVGFKHGLHIQYEPVLKNESPEILDMQAGDLYYRYLLMNAGDKNKSFVNRALELGPASVWRTAQPERKEQFVNFVLRNELILEKSNARWSCTATHWMSSPDDKVTVATLFYKLYVSDTGQVISDKLFLPVSYVPTVRLKELLETSHAIKYAPLHVPLLTLFLSHIPGVVAHEFIPPEKSSVKQEKLRGVSKTPYWSFDISSVRDRFTEVGYDSGEMSLHQALRALDTVSI